MMSCNLYFFFKSFNDLVWRCVGERFADVNVVDRVPHGGGGVLVRAGIS